jgi:mRNA-degrading endonuclease RelE of RelBE toxin-antitoxin system
MRSQATPKFWKHYARLPRHVQRQARKACQAWRKNPSHPSLRFRRVDDKEPIYSVRVSGDHRVLGFLESDTMIWFWIGDHDEYERLLKNV